MLSSLDSVVFLLPDVEGLIGDPSILNDSVKLKMLSEYSVNQMIHVELDTKTPFLITSYNQIDQTTFYQPGTSTTYSVDFLNKTATPSDVAAPQSSQHESTRAAASAALVKYANDAYKKGKCLTEAYVNNNNLILCLSAINTNLGAFWTGNWRATYTIDLTKSGSQEVDAYLDVNIHYFESGNLQFKATYAPKGIKADASDISGLVKAIEKTESDWQSNLERLYVDMHHETFKAMRRILPLTKTKMNWTISAHSLADELNK